MVVLLLMMTTSWTRRTKAVNLPLVLIGGESEMTFQLARHPGNDAHHTSDGFPAHQQNETLLSIQKFPQLYSCISELSAIQI